VIDLHNHIIPAVDDGCASLDESLMLARIFRDNGYRALCATPHIRQGMFDNSEEALKAAGQALAAEIAGSGIGIDFRFAAEYYFDERLLAELDRPENLLTLDPRGRYILIEFSYQRAPLRLKEFVFQLSLKGLRMVMAHPERYDWIANDFEFAADLAAMGAVMQGTLSSLAGEMGSRPSRTLKAMLRNDLIHIIASDCHGPDSAIRMLENSLKTLKKETNAETAEILLEKNPAIIYEGRSL